jgi:hypothetical protein
MVVGGVVTGAATTGGFGTDAGTGEGVELTGFGTEGGKVTGVAATGDFGTGAGIGAGGVATGAGGAAFAGFGTEGGTIAGAAATSFGIVGVGVMAGGEAATVGGAVGAVGAGVALTIFGIGGGGTMAGGATETGLGIAGGTATGVGLAMGFGGAAIAGGGGAGSVLAMTGGGRGGGFAAVTGAGGVMAFAAGAETGGGRVAEAPDVFGRSMSLIEPVCFLKGGIAGAIDELALGAAGAAMGAGARTTGGGRVGVAFATPLKAWVAGKFGGRVRCGTGSRSSGTSTRPLCTKTFACGLATITRAGGATRRPEGVFNSASEVVVGFAGIA